MRSMLARTSSALLVMLASAAIGFTAPPQLVNYQGEVTNGGVPVANGNYPMEFRIYAASAGGMSLWNETVGAVSVNNGRFNVLLGAVNPLPENIFDGNERWLETIFNGQQMNARTRLVTVPYAHRISTVDGASGGDISSPVTINTNSAGNWLEVYNTGFGRAGRFENTNGTNPEIALLGVSNSAAPGVAGFNPNGGPGVHSIGDLVVQDLNFVEKVRIDPIGNGSAGQIDVKLSDGTATVQLMASEIAGQGGEVRVSNDAGTVNVELDGEAAGGGGQIVVHNGSDATLAGISSGYLRFGATNGPNLVMDNDEIMARNNGAVTDLHLQTSGGAVTIGTAATTAPDGYILAVEGKSIMEEVEVSLSVDWPDYVFEPGYDLMPLAELERHVTEKRHLPGIPSEADMVNSRLPLGEMQTKLLEKVEELTLYVLQLKGRLDESEKDNAVLRDRVNALEAGGE